MGGERVDEGRTVTMPMGPQADPDATVLSPLDPGATRAEVTRERADSAAPGGAPDDLPTIVVPKVPGQASEGPDGLDAMDDPYYAPAVPDDLTSARAPVSIPSPVQSLPERRRRLPRWAAALLAMVLVAAAAVGAKVSYDRELWGGRTVPPVVGMGQEEATSALSRLGFAVEAEYRAVDDGFGVVLACDPAPGTRADPGAGATITVSVERTVPAVVGRGVDEARQMLLDAGAGSILLSYRNSDQPSGTVLAVDPAEGEPFTSDDTITLTVARSYTVPNVLGMSADEAQAALADEGLAGSVTYVESAGERDTVVACVPDVGEQVGQGATIELQVACSFPSSPLDLMGYFDVAPLALADYLEGQGFSRVFGEIYAASGNAHAAYSNDGGDVVKVTDEPEAGSYASSSGADVLRSGAGVGGVRYAFSPTSLPHGAASETVEGVRAVMEACGLAGMTDSCTQDDATMPDAPSPRTGSAPEGGGGGGTEGASPHFICASGAQGEYTWAVFIGGREGATKVVAMVAPTEHFSSLDGSAYGGVCDYVAYANLYR